MFALLLRKVGLQIKMYVDARLRALNLRSNELILLVAVIRICFGNLGFVFVIGFSFKARYFVKFNFVSWNNTELGCSTCKFT